MQGTERRGVDPARLRAAAVVYLIVGAVWALAHAAGLLGVAAGATFVLFGLGTVAATAVGVAAHRPTARAPWALFAAALLLFLAGGVARAAVQQVGDLSAERVIGADLVTLLGYVALGFALLLLTRDADEGGTWSLDVFLDAAIVSLSALSALWAFELAPALEQQQAGVVAKLVLGAYPAMSVFLVTVAVQLLANAIHRRSFSFVMVVVSVVLILIGDVVYMLVELGAVTLDQRLIDLPYVFAYVAFGATALHPTMTLLGRAGRIRPAAPSRLRMALVAGALLIPGAVAVSSVPLAVTSRLVLGTCMALLAVVVAVRLWRSMQAHDQVLLRLRHQADHDPLTALPNRTAVGRLLQEHLDRGGRPVAVLFLDLDRFKFINDSFGHTVGDQLLIEVADRLRATIDGTGWEVAVARVGGDEFLAVLTGADLVHAVDVAEQLRGSFTDPFQIGTYSLFSGASIGVAFAPPDRSIDANDLIRNADAAMYEAKDHGRDGVAVFDDSMVHRVRRRVALEAELRGASRRGELRLEFQPIVRLDDGRPECLEALLRWDHPDLGQVSPLEFVPVAEETGLILEVGAWVLEEACRVLATLRREVPGAEHLRVAVNVCARQVHEGGLVAQVERALARHGLDGSALQVELTESAFLGDLEATVDTLAQLRDRAVHVSLDDFGTGYSSLSYLRRYEVDEVKIDRAFVRDLGEDAVGDASLVTAILEMARALRLTTVAEGVETEAQAARLRDLRCAQAQGYWYARPTVPAALPTVLGTLFDDAARRVASEPSTRGRPVERIRRS